MARKTREEAEKTRELLLDTALQLFDEQGINHTTLNQIAKKAGVTRGAIYWHFKDRDDMFRALWEEVAAPMEQRFEDLSQLEGHDPLDALTELATQFLTRLSTDAKMEQLHRISLQALTIPSLMQWFEDCDRKNLSCLEKLMKQIQEQGKIRTDISHIQASRMLFSCISGLIGSWLLYQEPSDLPQNSALYVQLALDGLMQKTTG